MELQEYIRLRYKPRKRKLNNAMFDCCASASLSNDISGKTLGLKTKLMFEKPLPKVEKTFMEQVFAIIDEKGLNDVETYKKANIDRRLFSKMRSDLKYRPSRDTAFKFCFALELDLPRAKQLLSSAGFAISRSNMRDIVFEYCLTEKIYDLMRVNDKLYEVNVEPELE